MYPHGQGNKITLVTRIAVQLVGDICSIPWLFGAIGGAGSSWTGVGALGTSVRSLGNSAQNCAIYRAGASRSSTRPVSSRSGMSSGPVSGHSLSDAAGEEGL